MEGVLEADVGDAVQLAQAFHHHRPDLARGDLAVAQRLDLALGRLPVRTQAELTRALAIDHEQPGGGADRAALARRLHDSLRAAAVPVIEPAGGHGVFVDARAFLSHLPTAAHPTAALCNALYLAGGLRAGANPALPTGEAASAADSAWP